MNSLSLPSLPYVETFLIAVGGLLLLLRLLIVFSAERGRKHDLVKRLYRARHDFNVSVLIPFIDDDRFPELMTLLSAIAQQDYPTSQVVVHIGATDVSATSLQSDTLPSNVRLWTQSTPNPSEGEMTAWLIDRTLAQGDAGVVLFLNPDDMIKPDCFQHVVTAALEHPVTQGYVATKRRPAGGLERVFAIGRRLTSRIEHAGRYHLGLGCRLQRSGWAIRQELLEKVPFCQRVVTQNLEYTLRLRLAGISVAWAPTIMVFSEDHPHSLLNWASRLLATFWNRADLLVRYSVPLLLRGITRLDWRALEHWGALWMWPYALVGWGVLVTGMVGLLNPGTMLGDPLLWLGMVASMVIVHLLSLVVARCKATEFQSSLLLSPALRLFATLLTPMALLTLFMRLPKAKPKPDTTARYKQQAVTRLNDNVELAPTMFETGAQQEAVIRDMLVENAPSDDALAADAAQHQLYTTESFPETVQPIAAIAEKRTLEPTARFIEKTVPLSNGKRHVQCLLKTQIEPAAEDGMPTYCMTLEYKQVSFSTQRYRILDQAFYELESKLMGRGLSVITCGSCGYYYNPTADVPETVKDGGVCLFDKKGCHVNMTEDAVTVCSQACEYHAPLDLRETIVREWRDSLSVS